MTEPRWQRPDTSAMSAAEAVAYLIARCPWGAAQTHTGLQKHLIEETHELIGALDDYAAEPNAQTAAEVEGELGDVLYQVLFHAALLDRRAAGGQPLASMDDHEELPGEPLAAEAISRIDERLTQKIIRRHPHVFDSSAPVDIAEVERRYEAIKAAERRARQEAAAQGGGPQDPAEQAAAAARASFDSLPASVPALTRAQSVLGRIERLELTPPAAEPAGTSGTATTTSGTATTTSGTAAGAAAGEQVLGRALFALVAQAHAQGLDAEAALRRVTSEAEAAAVEQARSRARQEGADGTDEADS
ncbi:MazG nucleotide pyrophosphohydrolase domain-containing protein [Brevibacterium otitidis]|uniref:MazG nucleotide pyrophosphohydrolase domain-containing protein n=1 Tax=Brevibacterium otitidis TaxID=53364 RepID=A0ABV5WYY3_9MICO|nr:hypothetical protein GCM10023233_18900 [Brevibacterium otitidis]